MDRTFSTLEISRICHVDPVTVARWCDQGEIKCFKTPGGHRRVLQEDLLAFLRRQGIPVPEEFGRPGGRPLRILIVDDDPDILRIFKTQVRAVLDHRAVVETAVNGVEALLKIGSDVPDVVILDLLLPKMDGTEVCRRIKENPKTSGVRVVAVTASTDRRRAAAVVRAGAVACLVKPVRLADLLAHLGLPPSP